MVRKAFFFAIFLIINVHLWNETNLHSHNYLHSLLLWALQSGSAYWDTRYWCFGLARKCFLSIIFLIIKVRSSNDSNLDSCNNLYSFCDWALQSCLPYYDTRYWVFGFLGKAFFSTISCIIKVHPWNELDLDSHNNLHSFCDWGLKSCSPHWDTRYWCFGFARKAFIFTIFRIIKVHPWNESNLDTSNNLYSFYYRHYNSVLLIKIHYINALDWQEKVFFPSFSL